MLALHNTAIIQVCGATHPATVTATLRVADLLCMEDSLEVALQLLQRLHAQVRRAAFSALRLSFI